MNFLRKIDFFKKYGVIGLDKGFGVWSSIVEHLTSMGSKVLGSAKNENKIDELKARI